MSTHHFYYHYHHHSLQIHVRYIPMSLSYIKIITQNSNDWYKTNSKAITQLVRLQPSVKAVRLLPVSPQHSVLTSLLGFFTMSNVYVFTGS